MSQKEAGPEDDLQDVKVQVKRIAAKAVMISSFIFIGLYKTKITIEYRILEILLTICITLKPTLFGGSNGVHAPYHALQL